MPALKPIVRPQDGETPAKPVLVDIDLDELEEDRRDIKWQSFLKRARAYRQELRRQGRLR